MPPDTARRLRIRAAALAPETAVLLEFSPGYGRPARQPPASAPGQPLATGRKPSLADFIERSRYSAAPRLMSFPSDSVAVRYLVGGNSQIAFSPNS